MSQENLQTMIMQKFWGVKEVYYGIVQVVNKGPIVNYVPGRGGGGGFGGGYNFKTSPFLGGKFFTGKKHEGG